MELLFALIDCCPPHGQMLKGDGTPHSGTWFQSRAVTLRILGLKHMLRSVYEISDSGREWAIAAQTHLLLLIILVSFLIKPTNKSLILPFPHPWLLSQSRTQQGSHLAPNLLARQVFISLAVHRPSALLPFLCHTKPSPSLTSSTVCAFHKAFHLHSPCLGLLTQLFPSLFQSDLSSLLPHHLLSVPQDLFTTLPTPATSASSPIPRPSSPAPAQPQFCFFPRSPPAALRLVYTNHSFQSSITRTDFIVLPKKW